MSEHSPRPFEPEHPTRSSPRLYELATCTATGPAAAWLPAAGAHRAPARPRAVSRAVRLARAARAAGQRWARPLTAPVASGAVRRLLTETLPAASGLALLAFGFLLLVFSV